MKQVVIEMSNDAYEAIIGSGYVASDFNMISAIRNGIVLPEQHGDLIDRDELLKDDIGKIMGFRESDIRNAPTILEATKEDEE